MHFLKLKVLSYVSATYVYRWHALAIAWLVCLAGWGGVALVPDRYKAEAKVYIDADSVMDPLLKGLTVSVDPSQEIVVMLRTLITRPTLEQVIHLTMPDANKLTPEQMEQQVQDLQDRISISQLEAKNYYSISYTDKNNVTAASVAQALLSILQNNKIGTSRLNMDDARSFISRKVTEYETRLREADKRRADFRAANLDILGKSNPGNPLDAADAAYQRADQDYDLAVARRDTVKAQLDSTPKTVAADERMFLGPAIAGLAFAGTAVPRPTSTAARLQQARTALDELLAKFTDSHPDVVAAKKMVDQLQAEVAAEDAAAAEKEAAAGEGAQQPNGARTESIMIPNPVYVQLRTKLSDEEANVSLERQRLNAAAKDLEEAKRQAPRAIDVVTRYQELDRDYGNVEATYKQLLQSREAASLSQAKDDVNEAISFRVLETPSTPLLPTAPNRIILNSIVLVMGIGAGIGAAVLLMMNAERLVTTQDIAMLFAVPVLGVVTKLREAVSMRARISTASLAGCTVLLLVVYAVVLATLQTSINARAAIGSLRTSVTALFGAEHV